MTAIYLHGFASGPGSTKGTFFRERLEKLGVPTALPDLTEGDFEHSTLSQQLSYLAHLLTAEPTVLIGSSMGGYLAALFAARHPARVRALVLLAPAFDLARRWSSWTGEKEVQDWRKSGWTTVHHYGRGSDARLSYDLIADGMKYEAFPRVKQPVLDFHGQRDESVDYRLSEEFARRNPAVELVLLDSDHQLLDMLEPMWETTRAFLERVDPQTTQK